MATHSSTPAWKIPRVEEPGRLKSMGSRRVGHTRLSNFTFTFHFHALDKEMATHSSVLGWRIPGMVEPGRLPSLGLHRVWHDWSDLAAAALNWNGSPFYPCSNSMLFWPLFFYLSLSQISLHLSTYLPSQSFMSISLKQLLWGDRGNLLHFSDSTCPAWMGFTHKTCSMMMMKESEQ